MKISIIIPCWDDATALLKLVDRLRNVPDTQWIAVLVNPERSIVTGLERRGVECLSFPRPNRGAQNLLAWTPVSGHARDLGGSR